MESKEKLPKVAKDFGRTCDRMKLKMYVGKFKVLVFSKEGRFARLKMKLNNDGMETM